MDPVQSNEILTTERLTLRPLGPGDAATVTHLCGNLAVAHMLAAVPHPYPDGLAESWIAELAERRAAGKDYVFAIVLRDELVGVVGLEWRDAPALFELGYWLGEPWWGRGLMTEAARRVMRFAAEDLGCAEILSGHFDDNPASARVLEKCGFRDDGATVIRSIARGCEVPSRRFLWRRSDAAPEGTPS